MACMTVLPPHACTQMCKCIYLNIHTSAHQHVGSNNSERFPTTAWCLKSFKHNISLLSPHNSPEMSIITAPNLEMRKARSREIGEAAEASEGRKCGEGGRWELVKSTTKHTPASVFSKEDDVYLTGRTCEMVPKWRRAEGC